MNKSTLAIAIGLLLVANTGFAKTTKMTLEQRLEQLESVWKQQKAVPIRPSRRTGSAGTAGQ
jgi:hypothetical protein